MIIHPSLTGLTHLYLLLTTLLHTAQASPSCTALYGFPSYSACDELLYGDDLSSGYTGIGYTDSKDHFFALPLTSRPPLITDEQWENKVNLPIIRSNRKSIFQSRSNPTSNIIPSPLQTSRDPPLVLNRHNHQRHKRLLGSGLHRRLHQKRLYRPQQTTPDRRPLPRRRQRPSPHNPLRPKFRLRPKSPPETSPRRPNPRRSSHRRLDPTGPRQLPRPRRRGLLVEQTALVGQ